MLSIKFILAEKIDTSSRSTYNIHTKQGYSKQKKYLNICHGELFGVVWYKTLLIKPLRIALYSIVFSHRTRSPHTCNFCYKCRV